MGKRYTDLDSLIALLRNNIELPFSIGDSWSRITLIKDKLIDYLEKNAPVADVAPVRQGQWICMVPPEYRIPGESVHFMNNCTDCVFCTPQYVDKYRPYRRRFFCERRKEHLDWLTICSCFRKRGGDRL